MGNGYDVGDLPAGKAVTSDELEANDESLVRSEKGKEIGTIDEERMGNVSACFFLLVTHHCLYHVQKATAGCISA